MRSFLASYIVVLVLTTLLPLVAICLSFPYLALRLRDSREVKPDPELGLKATYYLLLSAAILLILFGLTIAAIDLMDGAFGKPNAQQGGDPLGIGIKEDKDSFFNFTQRVGWALVLSGVFFTLTFMLLIKMGTNDAQFPAAKRVFVGGRLAFSGVVVLLAVTALIVLFFLKELLREALREGSIYEDVTAILMVWMPALAVHVFLMRLYAKDPYFKERTERSGRGGREFMDDD